MIMFGRCLRAEVRKLHGSLIWLAVAVLPLISAVMGTFNYLGNLGILQDQWYSLWTQHALFYCLLFAPALTGVYCAYLCRLEHMDRNWNMVRTMPVPCWAIFAGKLAVISLLSLVTQLVIGLLFILSGKLIGLTAPIPLELFLWLARGWCAITVQGAILLCCALVIRSFAVPVGLGLIGGLSGLAIIVQGVGGYWPFSLLMLGMCANHPSAPMDCSPLLFTATTIIWLFLAIAFGTLWLQKRDVQTT